MIKKLLLGIPTYKSICSEGFAYQMSMLLDGINSGFLKRLEIEANMYVTMARNKMCRSAIDLWKAGEITHLLMVDDDVLIPPGGIAKLCSRDFPVVSGVYYDKSLRPVAYNFPFEYVKTVPSSGITLADGTGGGCLLIDCTVLNRISEEFGDEWWFQNTIILSDDGSKNLESYLGEDVFFFRRLNRLGIRVALDCDVQCGHIGTAIADRTMFEIKNGLQTFIPTKI